MIVVLSILGTFSVLFLNVVTYLWGFSVGEDKERARVYILFKDHFRGKDNEEKALLNDIVQGKRP